ncbi:MAG: hypothetical protein ABI624_11910 [Casimicrobiaceae bacterium]
MGIAARMHFDRPVSKAMWIAGLSSCALAALGFVAMARVLPAVDAGAAAYAARTGGLDAESAADDPQAPGTRAPPAINRAERRRCPECGVIVATRRIDSSGNGVGDAVERRFAGSIARGADAGDGPPRGVYEITVRYRNGDMLVVREATERTLRSGGRVIVVEGTSAPRR